MFELHQDYPIHVNGSRVWWSENGKWNSGKDELVEIVRGRRFSGNESGWRYRVRVLSSEEVIEDFIFESRLMSEERYSELFKGKSG